MITEGQGNSTLIFLCVANSARSQMAEGLARASAPNGWRVFSAGSDPRLVHPLAVEVMREIDIDISEHRSKGLEEIPVDDAHVIVTLCDEEVCPTAPASTHQLHWPLPDPAVEGEMVRYQIDAFRAVRDQIKQRLDEFWAEYATRD
jgi:arsenate reductase